MDKPKISRPKFLPATLREKNRYVAYQVISEQKLLFSDLNSALWNSILNFLGELDSAKMRVWIMKDTYDDAKQTGTIKCAHDYVEHVRSALILIQRIGDVRVAIKILGVSGTMKGARTKFLPQERTIAEFVKEGKAEDSK
ncbi:MAG: Rpp14/Pop5 family protein [Candidatus Aenigmatarchaeota archaeon]